MEKYLASSVPLHGQRRVVFLRYSSFHNADIAILTGLGTAQKITDLHQRTLHIEKCFEVSRYRAIQKDGLNHQFQQIFAQTGDSNDKCSSSLEVEC